MSHNPIIEFLTSSLAIDINRSLSTVIFIIDASFNDASSFELSSIDIWLSHHYDFPRANPVIKTRSIQYMSPRKLVLDQHTIDSPAGTATVDTYSKFIKFPRRRPQLYPLCHRVVWHPCRQHIQWPWYRLFVSWIHSIHESPWASTLSQLSIS